MTGYQFSSDNGAPVCDKIMQAIVKCNSGTETAYGADQWTKRLNSTYSEFFERECFVFPVLTGTAGNGLALGAVTPSYGTIFCHKLAHIVTTECGASEFYSGGSRLTLMDGTHNKIKPQTLQQTIQRHGIGNVHHMHASTLSVTQATESGVCYSLKDLSELNDTAHQNGLKTHLDGARFANALVHLGSTPADMTWRVGVDLLTFGTTKNGTMNAEAVITFDHEIANVLRFMHKRSGHLSSKMRYMSVQLLTYLEEDLWRYNAIRANESATRVVAALRLCKDVIITHPVHINEVFVKIPPLLGKALQDTGIHLRPWECGDAGNSFRMVMSYCDTHESVSEFEAVCSQIAAADK